MEDTMINGIAMTLALYAFIAILIWGRTEESDKKREKALKFKTVKGAQAAIKEFKKEVENESKTRI